MRAGTPRAALARPFGSRLAFLVELDELVFAGRHFRQRRLAVEHRVGDALGVQRDRAHGVIVARDDVVDVVRRAVGVDDRDDRDAELLGLVDRDLFVADVDHEQHVGQRIHFLDAAEAALELVALAAQALRFALAVLLERAVRGHLIERRAGA